MSDHRKTEETSQPIVRVTTRTDVGRVRQRNEDFVAFRRFDDRSVLVVVADGMGGHRGGDVASRLAVDTIVDGADPDADDVGKELVRLIRAANAAVRKTASDQPELSGMGTTIVAAWLAPEQTTIANVGDSRAWVFQDGMLRQITDDHSLVGDLVRSGSISKEQAADHPQRNVLTRALGTADSVEVDIFEAPTDPSVSLLLASDGLHGMISESDIGRILGSETDPEREADALIAAALDAGGSDNVTVAIVSSAASGQGESGPDTHDPDRARPVATGEKSESADTVSAAGRERTNRDAVDNGNDSTDDTASRPWWKRPWSWILIVLGAIAVMWSIIALDLFDRTGQSSESVTIDSTWHQLDTNAQQQTPADMIQDSLADTAATIR